MLCPAELGDLQFDREQAEVFAIEIQIAAVEIPVFRARHGFLLVCWKRFGSKNSSLLEVCKGVAAELAVKVTLPYDLGFYLAQPSRASL